MKRERANPAWHAAVRAVSTEPTFVDIDNDAADAFVRERKDFAIRAWREAAKTSGLRDIAVFLLHPDDEIAQAFIAPQGTPLVRPLAVVVPLPEAIAWLNRMGEYALAEGFTRVALYPNVGFVALAYGTICVGAWQGGAKALPS